jgi:hypothetical protein
LVISPYAPLLFAIVADLALGDRTKRLQEWRTSLDESLQRGPKHHELAYLHLRNGLDDLVAEEEISIERRELSGPDRGEYWSDPDLAASDGGVPNLFLEFIERLAPADITFYGSTVEDITYNYDSFFDAKHRLLDLDLEYSGIADQAIQLGHVLWRELPRELLENDRSDDRVFWFASHFGGANGDIELVNKYLSFFQDDHPDASTSQLLEMARSAVEDGYILLKEIPKELLAEGRAEDCIRWLASQYDGAEGDMARAEERWSLWNDNHVADGPIEGEPDE